MKKVFFVLMMIVPVMALSFCLSSCGGSDDDGDDDILQKVTITELQNTPSYLYSASSYKTYVWFRNGKMTVFKNASSSSNSTYTTYSYNISGYTFTLTADDGTTYTGAICVNTQTNKLVISQSMDGTGPCNLPEIVVHEYSKNTQSPDI